MDAPSKLSDWLPTKLARKIALSTLPIAIGGASLVHFLRPLMPSTTEAEITLLQISTALLLALLCALAALRSVSAHAKDLKIKHAAEIEAMRESEKINEDFMAQQINYDNRGIV